MTVICSNTAAKSQQNKNNTDNGRMNYAGRYCNSSANEQQ